MRGFRIRTESHVVPGTGDRVRFRTTLANVNSLVTYSRAIQHARIRVQMVSLRLDASVETVL